LFHGVEKKAGMGTGKHFKGHKRMYKSMVYFFILKNRPILKIGISGMKKG